MAILDVETLLAPVSPSDPSGPNLEYDRDFASLDRLALGKPERQMGDVVVAGEEPDWKALVGQTQALLSRTKDLRVACHLAKALLRTAGLPGFGDGLRVVRGLLERYWDSVHPGLDPDEDNDPTMRVNTLAGLCDAATLAALRATPLVNARSVGRFSLRDLAAATGEATPAADQVVPELSTIEAAFDAVDLEALSAIAGAAKIARDEVAAVEALVAEKVGSAQGANLSKLSALLDQTWKHLRTRLDRRAPVVAEEASGGDTPAGEGQPAPQRGGGMPGQIRSRDDVVRALEQVCAYYERHEPSSPVPLLMKRAKRLATMSFLDIMKDMAPDAVSQVELIGGRSDSGEGSSS